MKFKLIPREDFLSNMSDENPWEGRREELSEEGWARIDRILGIGTETGEEEEIQGLIIPGSSLIS